MAINLVKGQRVEIGLSRLIVEMGWKVNPNAKTAYDLDASTFLLRSNGEIGVEEDFVFYGSCKTIDTPDGKRPVSNDGSVLGQSMISEMMMTIPERGRKKSKSIFPRQMLS